MNDMLDKIQKIEQRYKELGLTLSNPDVIADYEKFRDLSKQRKAMEETVETYNAYMAAKDSVAEAKELLHGEKDSSMREFLNNEIASNEAKIVDYEEKMKVLLLPKDPMDDKDIMLEIRGSAGGDEANIFAGDLMRMYLKFANNKGWQTKILSINYFFFLLYTYNSPPLVNMCHILAQTKLFVNIFFQCHHCCTNIKKI